MPDSAFVKGEAYCPACGQCELTHLRCQWGVLPRPGSEYALGDKVAWLRDSSGSIVPPYVLVGVGPNNFHWNCGDPQVENVILFDLEIYANDGQIECATCHAHFVALVAVVRDGVFREIRSLDDAEVNRILGASRGTANIVIIRDDGSYWPREDWYDKAIEYRPSTAREGEPASASQAAGEWATVRRLIPEEEARMPIDRAIAAFRRGEQPEETCAFCQGAIQVDGGPPGGPYTFVVFTCPCKMSAGFFKGM